jgi:hypothetical protein
MQNKNLIYGNLSPIVIMQIANNKDLWFPFTSNFAQHSIGCIYLQILTRLHMRKIGGPWNRKWFSLILT